MSLLRLVQLWESWPGKHARRACALFRPVKGIIITTSMIISPIVTRTKFGVATTTMPGRLLVEADPYSYTFDSEHTALVIIDMQADFCRKGGYVDKMGYDISLTAIVIDPIKRVLAKAREVGMCVIHTREGHRPDLSDCQPNKLWRSKQIGAGIGDPGPLGRILVRGEPGWDIIPELYPTPGEVIIDKPGKGSFYGTDFELELKRRGITHLVLTGITTDVCVHTTMRDANDRGYECLLLEDCTGATDLGNYHSAIKMVKMQGGVFGTVSNSEKFVQTLNQIKPNE